MRQVERDKLGEQLSAYLDGELDEARATEVEALIEQSDEARQLLDELRAVADHVASLPRVRAPDSLGGKVRQHAEREILAGKRRHQRGGRIIRLLGTITASAAVLAACLLVGYQTLRWDTGSGTLSSTEKTEQSYVMRDATTVDEYVAARKVEPAPPRVAIGGKSRSPAEAADRAIRTETPRARASEIDAAESEKLAWANAGEQSRDESEPSIAAAPELAEDLLLAEVGPPTSAVGDEVQARTPDVDVVIAAQSSEQYARAVAAVQEWQAGEATPYLGERFRGGSELRAGLTDKAGVQMYGWGLVKATEHSLELDVPAAGVARLIGTLESTAPQQVSVTFNDVPAGSLDLLTPEAGYTIAGGEWKERGVRGDDAENARAHFGVAMARAPAETPKKTPESAAPASPSEARELPADKPVERLAGRGGGGGARRATTAARMRGQAPQPSTETRASVEPIETTRPSARRGRAKGLADSEQAGVDRDRKDLAALGYVGPPRGAAMLLRDNAGDDRQTEQPTEESVRRRRACTTTDESAMREGLGPATQPTHDLGLGRHQIIDFLERSVERGFGYFAQDHGRLESPATSEQTLRVRVRVIAPSATTTQPAVNP